MSKYTQLLARSLKMMAAGLAIFTFASCATSGGLFKTAKSSLPLETVDTTRGHIETTNAFETNDTLYVAGRMHRPIGHHVPATAHVDVRLIDRHGQVLAEKQDDIKVHHPRLSTGRGGKYSYVVSFPLAQARQAAKIQVSYHLVNH